MRTPMARWRRRRRLRKRNFLRGAAAPLIAISAIDRAARANAAECPVAPAASAAPAAGKTYGVRPDIHPDLKAHGAIFERKIHRIGDNVYSAVGWADGNSV